MKNFTLNLTNDSVTLTAYLLDNSPELSNTSIRPAIIIMPGGGYYACSDREAEPVAMAFLAEGYQSFILRYSVKENAAFPKPLNDAEEALELIRNNSGEWGIDPDKIAACGFSAGGHLAAAVGTMGRVKPNALILGYPAILSNMGRYLPAPIPGVNEYVDATTPPTFIFHTFSDATVPLSNPLAFAAALNEARIPFEMHVFKNGAHGLSLAKPLSSNGLKKLVDSDAAKWFSLSVSWLKNVFGEFASDAEPQLADHITEHNVDVQLGVLWRNPECKALLQSMMPALEESPLLEEAMFLPLRILVNFDETLLPKASMPLLDQQLKAIPVGQS
ncbi:alpha/beta hydrolase [Paenibacillus sp. HN-1]|uniref:alpha/beta hydrolase n=1 Tax=Paenibacillus TaxID=44249 RepID=UPI001CA9BF3B|nr:MULTISPECIES: alpha/beta hydrolase [Paenibacillus]MBY9078349.1 alpha/beta hydrolase [Paenibacillus sp. CGMCC 1.18879]MBY9083161.1 alpha/beta hydrolase [Paenibacillus sinensis]